MDARPTWPAAREDRRSARFSAWSEAAAVVTSPAALYFLLRLRAMAPPGLPDPSMHTTFILDPGAIFARYSAWFTPTSRMREAARVGFLVPARLCELLFGAVPGFFVLRYALALIAIVPLYMLLRSRYGRWAGWLGIALVMGSPVFITAWGTDYPDSAVVSYLAGAIAALALSLDGGQRRLGWVLVGACLLTLAVWSHAVAVPLVIVVVAAYIVVRVWRDRAELRRDLLGIFGCGVLTTALLAGCSKLLIGPADFITPTVRSASYLAQPAQTYLFHSSSWAWAPYDTYLLVPPVVLAAFTIAFARRWRRLPTSIVFIAITAAAQTAVFAYLQFFGAVQTLETHFFSSMLWPAVTITLVFTVASIFQPIADRPAPSLRAMPVAVALAIPIAYELIGSPARMTWGDGGLILAAVVVTGSLVARRGERSRGRRQAPRSRMVPGALLAVGASTLLLGGILVMTTALPQSHKTLPGVAPVDPYPAYATALNGSMSRFLDSYAVDAEIPAFVGDPTYPGEILFTWEPLNQISDGALQGPVGLYHNAYTWASWTFPFLSAADLQRIERLKVAQVVIMSVTGREFQKAVTSLARFEPVVVRRGILSHGALHLHLQLVDLTRYIRNASPRRAT